MSSNEVVRDVQSVETYNASAKQKAAAKLSRIPVKVEQHEILRKPEWIRVRAGSANTRFYEIKQILRESNLNTVCEEASCPARARASCGCIPRNGPRRRRAGRPGPRW